ncbi:MAG: hypothetical protein N2747_01360 [Chitinophagaceae bacterium]|nr:hypothetical protein [Chitinophagaceae bacterium]
MAEGPARLAGCERCSALRGGVSTDSPKDTGPAMNSGLARRRRDDDSPKNKITTKRNESFAGKYEG